jgi:hypothetical protein
MLLFSSIFSFSPFFKMCKYVVEYFCSLSYIRCVERFHDDVIDDGMADLTYEFLGSQDI